MYYVSSNKQATGMFFFFFFHGFIFQAKIQFHLEFSLGQVWVADLTLLFFWIST